MFPSSKSQFSLDKATFSPFFKMPFSHTKLLRKRTSGISHSSNETKETAELQRRIHMINNAIARKDIAELRKLAVTGPGLVNDGLRRLAWPLLLRCEKGGEAREGMYWSVRVMSSIERKTKNAFVTRHAILGEWGR